MNKFRIIVIMMILTTLLCSVVSASEQSVTLNVYNTISDLKDENTTILWDKFGDSQEINVGDTFNIFGDSIKLMEIANDGNSAFFRFTNKDKSFLLGNGDSTSLDEFIFDTNKLKLVSINDKATTISVTKDNVPVGVWIEPSIGDKKYLTVNGINTFNPIDYGSDSGWTTTYEKEEVILYAERLEDVTVAFNMESDGNFEKEESNNMIKYYLKSNTEYKFTIDYTEIGLWGGESDITDTYMISITGLGETTSNDVNDGNNNGNGNTGTTNNNDASGSVPIVEGNYDVVLGNTKNIITDEDGEWTTGNGMNVDVNIQGEKYVWTFDFTEAGRYSPSFVSENGKEGHINFNVKDNIVNANQVPSNEDNSSNIGLIILILGILAGIAVVGNAMMKGNKNKKNIANIINNEEENEGAI